MSMVSSKINQHNCGLRERLEHAAEYDPKDFGVLSGLYYVVLNLYIQVCSHLRSPPDK